MANKLHNGASERDRVNDESTRTTRRTILKVTGTTAVTATGLAATSSSASAQWFGGSVEEFDLDGFGAADELPNSDEDELVIYLHGGGVGDSAGDQGESLQDGLADAGYDATVVAGVFSTISVGIGDATSDAAENLADMIEDYYDTTGGAIRMVGYSLGGIVTMQTLNALSDGYVVDTPGTIGTGAPSDHLCEGGVYYDGIANNAAEFPAFVSDNDSAVSSMDAHEPDCDGFFGGSPPDTLEMIDVTHDVDDHLSYLDSTAVMEELAARYDDGTGDDDDDDDDDGWFDWL